MKNILTRFLKLFCSISTAVVLLCAIGYSIIPASQQANTNTLWDILFSSLLTSLITMICLGGNIRRPWEFLIRSAIHYTLLCVTMYFFGVKFHWIPASVPGALTMMGYVAAVYLFTYLMNRISDIFGTNKVNQALSEKYKDIDE